MNTYQIITDSSCDFSTEMYKKLDLRCVPLTLQYQGRETEDKSDDSIRSLYKGLREGESASTSAINISGWTEAMEPFLMEGRDVLVLAFSSGLSTTYQNAAIAGSELSEKYPDRKIRVIDTLCASLGEGLLVWYACKHQQDGEDLDTVADWVERHKLNLCHWFTVDDLMYLKRGGRISAATALVGTMLNIKPVLHMDDEGHLINMSKARGRKASIDALAKKAAELGEGFDNSTMFISHGDCIEDARYLEQILKEKYGVKQVYINYVGAVIDSHSGPGTLALFFMGKHR